MTEPVTPIETVAARPEPSIVIGRARPTDPGMAELVAAADATSAALYPAASNHPLDLARLAEPDMTTWAAWLDGRLAGCIALRHDPSGYGEIKRMFVVPGARGRGLAQRLLEALEQQATAGGISVLRLETGVRSAAALNLYAGAGYTQRPPFGSYRPDPVSVFMEKQL